MKWILEMNFKKIIIELYAALRLEDYKTKRRYFRWTTAIL